MTGQVTSPSQSSSPTWWNMRNSSSCHFNNLTTRMMVCVIVVLQDAAEMTVLTWLAGTGSDTFEFESI